MFLNLQPSGGNFAIRVELRKLRKSSRSLSYRFELLAQLSLVRILLEKAYRDLF